VIRWRWLAGVALTALAQVTALGLGTVGLVELVERARAAGAGQLGALLALVGWRLPLLLRELLPALVAIAAGLAVAGMRRRGELVGLATSGTSPAITWLGVALPLGIAGAALAGALELTAPAALDRAAEAEAALAGRVIAVGGRWAITEAGLLRVGEASEQALTDVTLVRREGGRMTGRWDAGALYWDGEIWRASGARAYTFPPALADADLAGTPVDAVALPPPETLAALARRGSAAERGLLELRASGAPDARRWWWWRLAGLFNPLALAAAVATWTLRAEVGLAPAAAGSAAIGGAALLLGLALTDGGPPGLSGGALLLCCALAVAAARWRRPRLGLPTG
jgi:lipopolysaccharide export LptBFGC system permease protein LptF